MIPEPTLNFQSSEPVRASTGYLVEEAQQVFVDHVWGFLVSEMPCAGN